MLAKFIMHELRTPVSFAVHRDADRDAFGKIKPNELQGYHAHLYFPTRILLDADDGTGESDAGGEGSFGPKLKQFVNQASGSAMTERLNAKWAEFSNVIASQRGLVADYDHRSYKRLGVARQPEPKLGQAATAMERRGIRTVRGDNLRAHRLLRASQGTATGSGVDETPPAPAPSSLAATECAPAEVAPQIVLPKPITTLPPRPADDWRGAIVNRLTEELRLQSPTAYEPPSIVGLADRFEASAMQAGKNGGAVPSPKIIGLVRAIERALNALVTVARALVHLVNERRRYLAKLDEVRHEAELQQRYAERLRREDAAVRRPDAPRMSAAHRRRLVEIQTASEELEDKLRVVASLEDQLNGLSRRMDPWKAEASHERRQVKRQLGELLSDGADHVDQLLSVANDVERPWLQLYLARSEPTISLQKEVNRHENDNLRAAYTPQRPIRPNV